MQRSNRIANRSRRVLWIAARTAAIALLVASCGDGGDGGGGGGPTLSLSSPVTDSLVARVCLHLDSAGEEIAGTQNEIVWDPSCASLTNNSCAALLDGTSLHTALLGGSSMRAFVFSFENVDPLPDGDLYCCEFFLQQVEVDACCPLRLEGVRAATPEGRAVTVRAINGEICQVGSGRL